MKQVRRMEGRPSSVDEGDGGGEDGPMEARLRRVEEAVVELRQDVAVIKSNYVQRSDLVEQVSLLRGDMERQFSLVERQFGAMRGEFGQLRGELGQTRGELERQIGQVRGDLERQIGLVRADIHQVVTAQTWRLTTWVTTMCTLLVAATWYIARGH